MSNTCLYIYCLFFLFRFATMIISGKNEKMLAKLGAVEFGKVNSKLLVVAHFGFYIACLTEGILNGNAFNNDGLTRIGLLLYIFSIIVLYIVIYSIKHIWTVKLIIAPKAYHTINKGYLFKFIKHPNYFLNIIPELIGTALVFHSFLTLFIGLPIYLIPLVIRILQEEKVMKQHFQNYS